MMKQTIARCLRGVLPAAIGVVCLTGVSPVDATAAKPFLRGFSDPVFTYSSEDRTRWYDASVAVGTSLARIDLQWNAIASQGGPPAEPANPADPAYNFGATDQAIRDAAARGIPVLLTIQYAPDWALGDNPDTGFGGVWKPDPAALGDFAQAVATRYSGSFSPGLAQPPLPAVRYIEPWNEPNLPHFLSPQYKGRKDDKLASPDHYRKMLNEAYEGAHAGNGSIKVVAGSTAPFGDDPGKGPRTRPLQFLRDLLCLRKAGGGLEKTRCKQEAKLDAISHHPISTSGGPSRSAINPDDATVPDFKNVVEIIRAAERRGTVQPKGRRPAFATEVWWETNPPDGGDWAFPQAKVANWIPEMFYSLRDQGAEAAIWLQIVDTEVSEGFGGFQSGLFNVDGTPKPLVNAWRFPFVADRVGGKSVRAWAIPPGSGQLAIEEKRGGGWKTLATVNAHAQRPVQRKLRIRGSAELRATLNGESSSTAKARSRQASQRSEAAARRGRAVPATLPPELEPYVEAP